MPTYVIKIRNETSGGTAPGVASSGVSASDAKKNTGTDMSFLTSKLAPAGIAIAAYNAVNAIASYRISHVSLTTGNTVYQQKLSDIQGYVNKAASFAMTVGGGAAVGGWVGAVVAGGGYILKDAINYNLQEQTVTLQRMLEAETIRLSNVRAGAYGGRVVKN